MRLLPSDHGEQPRPQPVGAKVVGAPHGLPSLRVLLRGVHRVELLLRFLHRTAAPAAASPTPISPPSVPTGAGGGGRHRSRAAARSRAQTRRRPYSSPHRPPRRARDPGRRRRRGVGVGRAGHGEGRARGRESSGVGTREGGDGEWRERTAAAAAGGEGIRSPRLHHWPGAQPPLRPVSSHTDVNSMQPSRVTDFGALASAGFRIESLANLNTNTLFDLKPNTHTIINDPLQFGNYGKSISPTDITTTAAAATTTVGPQALIQQKGAQPNLVALRTGNIENWGESTMADTSPRTDTSTDPDIDERNHMVLEV